MRWILKIEIGLNEAFRLGIRDTYSWHCKVWDFFPGRPEAKRDFLTRFDLLDGGWRTWIVSNNKPLKPEWCSDEWYALKEIAPTFFNHRYYLFDLLANPVKSLVQKDESGKPLLKQNGKRRSGKRVPIIKMQELKEWLIRKTDEKTSSGFRIIEDRPFDISPMQKRYFRKKGISGYHGGVRFKGMLEVTNRENFINTYRSGIGSAKGFGFGLLLLAPINI